MRVHAHPALFLYPCTSAPTLKPHEPVITLAFMNVNNLYLRYKFGQRTPGRFGNDPPPPPGWGYLPSNFTGCYRAHDPLQVALLADVLGYQGLPEVLALCEVESMQALRHFNHTALGAHYLFLKFLYGTYGFVKDMVEAPTVYKKLVGQPTKTELSDKWVAKLVKAGVPKDQAAELASEFSGDLVECMQKKLGEA